MEDHGQQGARHGRATLGPAACCVTGRSLSLATTETRPATLARYTDLGGATRAAAAAHHRREP